MAAMRPATQTADKAVSTDDLEAALPHYNVTSELLRLEAALSAMVATPPHSRTHKPHRHRNHRPRSYSHHGRQNHVSRPGRQRTVKSDSCVVPGSSPGPSTCSSAVSRRRPSPSPHRDVSPVLSDHSGEHVIVNMCEEEVPLAHLSGCGTVVEGGAGGSVKRKKKKRRRRKPVDPDELPKRAKWTIVATACLLLLMSVLLVGVTLRMAPIIDEMVRKENELRMNSMRGSVNGFNSSIGPSFNISTTDVPAGAR